MGKEEANTSTSADAEPRNLDADHPSKSAFSSREEATEVNKVTQGSTAARQTSWLGLGLHLKGEIGGNVDLLIDGSFEGLVHLDDQTLPGFSSASQSVDTEQAFSGG